MSRSNKIVRQDLLGLRYLDALDAGDLETVAKLWEEASHDPEMENVLSEIDAGVLEEQGIDPQWPFHAAQVRKAARQTLTSSSEEETPVEALTAADVASRVLADVEQGLVRLPADDLESNRLLLQNRQPLPEQLGAATLQSWIDLLGISASPGYWRAFRQAAVTLAINRAGHSGQLAAARRPKTPNEEKRS